MRFLFIISPIIIGLLFFIRPRHRLIRVLFKTLRLTLVLLFIIFTLRMYWFDIYKIPSPSMEQTLMVDDKIIIHKGVLPQHNDVMVFQMKHWKNRMIMVKRCVGLPGDSLMIHQDSVFVNQTYLAEAPTVQWSYVMDSCVLSTTDISHTIHRDVNTWTRKKKCYTTLTKLEHDKIMEEYPFAILPQALRSFNEKGNPYPKEKSLKNNKSNYKPFLIPKQGVEVSMTKKNIAWYRDIIKLENDSVQIKNWKVFIHGKQHLSYTFKDNYYFMMGDNREQSLDSRRWGFIKEEFLLGKVILKCDCHFRNFNIIK